MQMDAFKWTHAKLFLLILRFANMSSNFEDCQFLVMPVRPVRGKSNNVAQGKGGFSLVILYLAQRSSCIAENIAHAQRELLLAMQGAARQTASQHASAWNIFSLDNLRHVQNH